MGMMRSAMSRRVYWLHVSRERAVDSKAAAGAGWIRREERDRLAGEMTEPVGEMHSHVALRVRLVYEPSQETGKSDVAGWRLVGMMPEDAVLEPAEIAAGRVLGEPVVL